MRHVILPLTAMILAPGKMCASDVRVSDRIGGYDLWNRRPELATISSVEHVETTGIVITLGGYMTLMFATDCFGLTTSGEIALAKSALSTKFIGYCHANQRNLIERAVLVISEPKPVQAVRFTWNQPDYLWSNGILVGHECTESDN